MVGKAENYLIHIQTPCHQHQSTSEDCSSEKIDEVLVQSATNDLQQDQMGFKGRHTDMDNLIFPWILAHAAFYTL